MGMIGEKPERRTKLAVLKVIGGRQTKVVVACDDVIGFSVHWLGGRSYMCAGDLCPACLADVGSRWNGCLVVRWSQGAASRLMLLELSASAWDRFFGLVRMEGWSKLNGLAVSISRARAKSPLILDPIGFLDGPRPEPVVVWRMLDAVATLYGLPSAREGEGADDWSDRAAPAAARLLQLAIARCES